MDHADIIERLRDGVLTGGAVCLLGAGFSLTATDALGQPIPSSVDLAEELKRTVGIDEDDPATLTDIADFCEASPDLQRQLRRLLITRLTQTRPSASQQSLLQHPWRSIFTTNFDDVIERCLEADRQQVITPASERTVRTAATLPLYYLHGRARDLAETDKDPRFVISERNYLNLHADNRDLYAQLKNELFAARLIVIIGYSMRDLEVARMLIEPGHAFEKKTVVVCAPTAKGLGLARLAKFGKVLPIGVDGLADCLAVPRATAAGDSRPPQFVELAACPVAASEIDGNDFVKLILTGDFRHDKYQAQLQRTGDAAEIYSVRRTAALDAIVNRPAGGLSRFAISSDLGNGKSVFLSQLAVELASTGHEVVRISSQLNEVFAELDHLLSSDRPIAYLIDDVIRYRTVAQYIGARLNNFAILVCSIRGAPNEVTYQQLTASLGGGVREIDLNCLSLDEVDAWDTALERWGLWEERIQLPKHARINFLLQDCGAENRSVVLSLFRTSHIARRIDQIVDFFLTRGGHRRTFAALLTSSLCQKHVTWESIVSWLDIDEQALRHDIASSEITDLFGHGRDWNALTSAQLAEYILRTRYVAGEKDTLVEVFSTIVQCTAESATDGRLGEVFRQNLKELMKFRFMTRLFGDDRISMTLIDRVYTRLGKAPLIRKNPQFWLQHGMSRMEVDDLDNAETYLNTALGLAKERGQSYSPFQILDQRSRLYFRKNTGTGARFSVTEIVRAADDLGESLHNPDSEAIYMFRCVPFIRDFVEDQIDRLSEDLKKRLLTLLEAIKQAGSSYTNLPRSQKGETVVLRKALQDTLLVLRNA